MICQDFLCLDEESICAGLASHLDLLAEVELKQTNQAKQAKQENKSRSSKNTKEESIESKQLREFQSDINQLLDKNEEAIRTYISRYIYTSSISPETNQLLETMFKDIRANLNI